MKMTRRVAFIAILAAALVGALAVRADDGTNKPAAKPIPYPLNTCAVCGMKLGEMGGKPCTFVYQGREIKVCDKSEEADFKKDPKKYLKDIDDAVAKAKTKAGDKK
jgi:nitrous oxide reductase accessory protein NosL